jgi:hypothetical protein
MASSCKRIDGRMYVPRVTSATDERVRRLSSHGA